MTSLARTACYRCREQKLRCSRETPSCQRCTRLGAICDFPTPPDRKVLAALRAQPKKRKISHPKSNPQRGNISYESPNSVSPNNSSHQMSTKEPECAAPEHGIHLSIAIQETLQEVYFSCMFNSNLIFHRPTFSRAFEERKLPKYLLLAIYASATTFLPPTSPLSRRYARLLQPLGDVQAMGRDWALEAKMEVLQHIDRPTFEMVQTCEVLTLYWFSTGDSVRNTMFLGIAYTAACTLGLDIRESTPPSNEAMSTSSGYEWLDVERMRRCFWAVWFTQCINADHTSMRSAHIDRIMDLPLPIDETSFTQSTQRPSYTLSTILDRSANAAPRDFGTTSIMAELMTLMLHWSKIRDLIRATNRVPIKDWLADLFELEDSLSAWSARLPPSFVYTRRNLYEQLIISQQPVYIFIHALYHQCRLVLHSSLVPQFSGLQFNTRPPTEAISLSARIALKSTQALSELGAHLIALDWDTAQIPAFVGYCMYVSASINIALLYAHDTTLAILARANLVSNLRLLKSLKLYWANLERLWARVNMLYATQISRRRATTAEGATWSTESETPLSDLDRIAGESRDTGQLAEPLAHSVLEYGLRKLKPNANTADAPSARELDRSMYPDDLAQLIDEGEHHQAATMTVAAPQPLPVTGEDVLPADSMLSPTAGKMWDRMKSPPFPSLQGNGYDLWQFSLDSIQEPVMPYDDLLGLDFSL